MTAIASILQAELEVRVFAAEFPTANVLAALAHCESGRLGWVPVRDLLAKSLASAIAEVA